VQAARIQRKHCSNVPCVCVLRALPRNGFICRIMFSDLMISDFGHRAYKCGKVAANKHACKLRDAESPRMLQQSGRAIYFLAHFAVISS
jgi:hypothetical protein